MENNHVMKTYIIEDMNNEGSYLTGFKYHNRHLFNSNDIDIETSLFYSDTNVIKLDLDEAKTLLAFLNSIHNSDRFKIRVIHTQLKELK